MLFDLIVASIIGLACLAYLAWAVYTEDGTKK